MRDLRDPESLGKVLLSLVRYRGVPVLHAADELTSYAIAQTKADETCIERYSRADEVEPRWEEIRVR